MNLSHYYKRHPFGSLLPEFDPSFYPTLQLGRAKRDQILKKNTSKFWHL